MVDSAQRVVAVNTGFEQLMQITRDSVLNQSYQNFTDSHTYLTKYIVDIIIQVLNSTLTEFCHSRISKTLGEAHNIKAGGDAEEDSEEDDY